MLKILVYLCATILVVAPLPISVQLDRNLVRTLPKSLDAYKSINSVKVSEFKTIGPLPGPESIAYFDGKLVTGAYDGYLYQILVEDDSVKRLIRLIEPEDDPRSNQSKPLRPLGVRFDSKGVLFVVEPSYGIYKVEDVFSEKPKVSLVLDIAQTASLGEQGKFFDDLALEERSDGNHVIYISDVSTKFALHEFMLTLFSSDTSGRILRYDMQTKKLDVVADGIFFPNGVQMAQDNQAVLFAGFATRNLYRHELKDPNKGQTRELVSGLPAEVDNIRPSATGQTYWLGMQAPRTFHNPNEFDHYLNKPLLRQLIITSAAMTSSVLSALNELMPGDFLAQLADSMRNLHSLHLFSSKGGMMVEIDESGTVLNSIYSTEQDLAALTEVREVPSNQPNQRILYIGSFALPYLRKMVISN